MGVTLASGATSVGRPNALRGENGGRIQHASQLVQQMLLARCDSGSLPLRPGRAPAILIAAAYQDAELEAEQIQHYAEASRFAPLSVMRPMPPSFRRSGRRKRSLVRIWSAGCKERSGAAHWGTTNSGPRF